MNSIVLNSSNKVSYQQIQTYSILRKESSSNKYNVSQTVGSCHLLLNVIWWENWKQLRYCY